MFLMFPLLYGLQTQMSNYYFKPIQFTALLPYTHVQFAPTTFSPNTSVQPLLWNGNQDEMQLCTLSLAGTLGGGTQVSSGT